MSTSSCLALKPLRSFVWSEHCTSSLSSKPPATTIHLSQGASNATKLSQLTGHGIDPSLTTFSDAIFLICLLRSCAGLDYCAIVSVE